MMMILLNIILELILIVILLLTLYKSYNNKPREYKGSVIGNRKLKEMFPTFKDDVAENGIDLRIGELYIINKKESDHNGWVGCVDDEKMPPSYAEVRKEGRDHYILEPKNFYFARIDRPIHIPKGYIQQYYLRSTFSRCGLILLDSVGDSDFNGTLMLGIYNSSPVQVHMGFNERIIQAVTIKTDGTDISYDGSYQKDRIYNEKRNLGQ